MRSPHFWGVTQLSLVVTDVSGQPVCFMLEGKVGYPEMWIRNYNSAQRNIPEDRKYLRFTFHWLQYMCIPLSLTENLYFSHTVFVLPHDSTITRDYVPEKHVRICLSNGRALCSL
jgi:hypothetical protein